MRTKFYGVYAPHIEQLITLKRQLGYKYNSEEYVFGLFDKFTISRGEINVEITKELAEAWCKPDPNESPSFRLKKTACINQMASFLERQGKHSYYLHGRSYTYSFCPYIFSRQEMDAIFSACDNLKLCSGQKSVIFSIPTLTRLLYGTGLRISEALALKNTDVNLEEHFLKVKDAKNGQERTIPISKSLSEACWEYVANRDKIPAAKSDHFFISLAGKKCEVEDVRRWFMKVLSEANIRRSATGPRLHDLRHTFCVHSLAQMAEAGTDLYCALPILSRYIGHVSLQSTNAYVRLTAEMYPGLLKEVEMVCFNVFPKLSPHETN